MSNSLTYITAELHESPFRCWYFSLSIYKCAILGCFNAFLCWNRKNTGLVLCFTMSCDAYGHELDLWLEASNNSLVIKSSANYTAKSAALHFLERLNGKIKCKDIKRKHCILRWPFPNYRTYCTILYKCASVWRMKAFNPLLMKKKNPGNCYSFIVHHKPDY